MVRVNGLILALPCPCLEIVEVAGDAGTSSAPRWCVFRTRQLPEPGDRSAYGRASTDRLLKKLWPQRIAYGAAASFFW
jgi:hypothetical protein